MYSHYGEENCVAHETWGVGAGGGGGGGVVRGRLDADKECTGSFSSYGSSPQT